MRREDGVLRAEAVGEGCPEGVGHDEAAAASEELGGVGDDRGGVEGDGEDGVEDNGVEGARRVRGRGVGRGSVAVGLKVFYLHVQNVALDEGGIRIAF